MNSNQVTSILKREKELLEEILDLVECQPELIESGRVEDLEILLSLREGPLSALAAIEEGAEAEMDLVQTATTEEIADLNELNLAILSLADRIVDLDEKADSMAEHCASAELSTETGAYFSE